MKTIVFAKKQNKIRAKKSFSLFLMIPAPGQHSPRFHWKRHEY